MKLYQEKHELLQLNFKYQNLNSQSFEQSSQVKKIEAERKRKVYMITGKVPFPCDPGGDDDHDEQSAAPRNENAAATEEFPAFNYP